MRTTVVQTAGTSSARSVIATKRTGQLRLGEQAAQHRRTAAPQRRIVDDCERRAGSGVIGRPRDWIEATTVVSVRCELTQSVIASSSLSSCTPCEPRACGSHFDPFPARCAGRARQHDDVEIVRAVGDAGLHHEGPRRRPSLGRGAGEADAALVDEIDEHWRRRQQRQLPTIVAGVVIGHPWLVGEPDTEHEGVVVGRMPLPHRSESCDARRITSPRSRCVRRTLSSSASKATCTGRLPRSVEAGESRPDCYELCAVAGGRCAPGRSARARHGFASVARGRS